MKSRWAFTSGCLLLMAFFTQGNADSFVTGEYYEIDGGLDGFTPIGPACHKGGGDKTNCYAPDESRFRVISQNNDTHKVVVRFLHVGEETSNSSVDAGQIYEHDANSLATSSELFKHPYIALKAVLIPQKIYIRNYQHSGNLTAGIALSEIMPMDDAFLHFLAAVDYGIGFNQISVKTAEGEVQDRTGLSWFLGYDFISTSNDGLHLGVYYGRDYVQLDDGDTFNGRSRNFNPWWGLVLSTPISK